MTPTPAVPSLWSRGPRIRALSSTQSEFILRRNKVGRLSFVADGRPELLPIHYVFTHGTLYARTSFGAKCAAWEKQPDVVMGVDESDGLFDWRSVLVRGVLRTLRPRGTAVERATFWEAVRALEALQPQVFTERDPTPLRRIIIAISPVVISGREASTHFIQR